MKKSVISIFSVIFLLFVTACDGGSSKNSFDGDIEGNGSYNDNYDADESGVYEPGYDTGDTGAYEDWETTDSESYDGADPSEPAPEPAEDPEPGDLIENEWVETAAENTSTFSIDVDTASYSLIRSYLMSYNTCRTKSART